MAVYRQAARIRVRLRLKRPLRQLRAIFATYDNMGGLYHRVVNRRSRQAIPYVFGRRAINTFVDIKGPIKDQIQWLADETSNLVNFIGHHGTRKASALYRRGVDKVYRNIRDRHLRGQTDRKLRAQLRRMASRVGLEQIGDIAPSRVGPLPKVGSRTLGVPVDPVTGVMTRSNKTGVDIPFILAEEKAARERWTSYLHKATRRKSPEGGRDVIRIRAPEAQAARREYVTALGLKHIRYGEGPSVRGSHIYERQIAIVAKHRAREGAADRLRRELPLGEKRTVRPRVRLDPHIPSKVREDPLRPGRDKIPVIADQPVGRAQGRAYRRRDFGNYAQIRATLNYTPREIAQINTNRRQRGLPPLTGQEVRELQRRHGYKKSEHNAMIKWLNENKWYK